MRFRNWLTGLPLKLLALIISIMIWFYLKNQPQLEELRIAYDVVRMPVKVTFDDELAAGTCAVSILPKFVDVGLKGRYQVLKELKEAVKNGSEENFKVYVEVPSEACEQLQGSNSLYLSVKVLSPRGVDVINIRPSRVLVKFEPLRELEYTVKLKLIGQPGGGMKLKGWRIDPPTVTVIAPASVVNKIDQVIVTAELEGLSFSTRLKLEPLVLDRQGKVLDGVSVHPKWVMVSLWIAR